MQSKFIKKVTTAAIAATTLISLLQAPTVLADNETATATTTGEANAKVVINKVLNIAEGITTPAATFKFTFTPKTGTSSNGAPYEVASETDAAKGHIPERTVTYSSADKAQQDKIVKPTEDIFKDVSYDHAGEYVYTVKEEANTYNATAGLDAIKYDTKTYDMHVIVKNKKGAGTYISSVFFKENGTTTTAEKKEPSTGSATEGFKYDLFENTYTKEGGKITPGTGGGGDTVDTNAKALTIKKQVSGGTADKTKDFSFKLVVKLPSTNKTAATPVQNITVNHGNKPEQVAVDQDGVTITKTFTLKHDETFTVDSLPAGSHYTVTETGTPGYTASAAYKANGEEKKQQGTQSADFTVQDVLVGEKTNENNITNDLPDVTPTGLLIDNLPFILMIGLGLTGFVALSRKRRQG